ncbi:MAG TPA: tRNA pseudouridine(55) synthase TruB, partial [Nevskiaceae bacterium]|nr:tRNA pseudouridine(55) synthase TruB [Nevskiaceae bacterium]
RAYRALKAGHTGSLDPLATGVLPICFGKATRLAAELLDADKAYRATVLLGVSTDSGDADGSPVANSDVSTLDAGALLAALPRFLGAQQQVPPMYSALKRDGQPLYKLARRGIEVERAPRAITIHELRLVAQTPTTFSFEVRCSKGTYVRTLAADWAAAVGQCAHLTALRRLRLGAFDVAATVTLEQVEAAGDAQRAAFLRPLESLLDAWPKLQVDELAAGHLRHGQAVSVDGAPVAGRVAVLDLAGRVLCLAEIGSAGEVMPKRWLGATA